MVDERLFRRESGRIVAALTRIFGPHNLDLAEDVAQDAFCRALEVWRHQGVPANPAAWLMTAAKHRAIDALRRERTARTYAPELGRLHESEWTLRPTVDALFRPAAIKDDQLRMMFSCCDPRLAEESRVALVLSVVCGFGVGEIAGAFLNTRAAVEKRITRGKHVLATATRLFDLTDADLPTRLESVQRAIYLLFSEGYHGASADVAVRTELCREAMRLGALLAGNPVTATPATLALCALMWLDAARLKSRVDAAGELSPLLEQDRSRWDRTLITTGLEYLDRSASGDRLTDYHVEAAIASVHIRARTSHETDWPQIVELYDRLMVVKPSPIVALNRAIAIAQVHGAERGLAEIATIADQERLADYPFYWAALGEFELRRGRRDVARERFASARATARNDMERRFYDQRIDECARVDAPV